MLYFCHHIYMYDGLVRKGLCTWSFLQAAASKRLKPTEIAFIPIGDCIFLPTKEVQYTLRSRLFSCLEPGANGLNTHAGIIYIVFWKVTTLRCNFVNEHICHYMAVQIECLSLLTRTKLNAFLNVLSDKIGQFNTEPKR